MKIKMVPAKECFPEVNETVLAINEKGFVGVAKWNGKEWKDVALNKSTVNPIYWILIEG